MDVCWDLCFILCFSVVGRKEQKVERKASEDKGMYSPNTSETSHDWSSHIQKAWDLFQDNMKGKVHADSSWGFPGFKVRSQEGRAQKNKSPHLVRRTEEGSSYPGGWYLTSKGTTLHPLLISLSFYNLFRYFQQLLPPQKTVQGLVLKPYLCLLKHPKEKLCCKKRTNQMPAHNFFFLLQCREFLEQPQKSAESA